MNSKDKNSRCLAHSKKTTYGFFSILTILIVISAIFGFINEKFLKLPDTIGLMLITILFTSGN